MLNIKVEKKSQGWIIVSLFLLAVSIRIMFFNLITPDMTEFLVPWYNAFTTYGRDNALGMNFANYFPPYLYLIDIMTLFPWIQKEIAIKLISLIFDFFAAFAVFKIIEIKFPKSFYRWLGFFGLLMLPTVVVDGSYWGQCDIIFVSFLLWSLYFILREKSFPAILAFSIALSFKMQAIFFLPVFMILFFQKKFKFWWFFVIPATLFLAITPAWIFGRSLPDLLSIYLNQANTYHRLSMRSPNLYTFIPNDHFEIKVLIGMIVAGLLILTYLLLRLLKRKKWDRSAILYDAALLNFIIPFILPKMHERYFFAGCIFMFVLSFYYFDFAFPTILVQTSSLLSYLPYLSGWSDTWVKIGAVINTVVAIFIVIPLVNKKKSEIFEQPLVAVQLEES